MKYTHLSVEEREKIQEHQEGRAHPSGVRSQLRHRRGCGSSRLSDIRRNVQEREGGTHRP